MKDIKVIVTICSETGPKSGLDLGQENKILGTIRK